jgi:hypothetical protein
LPWEISPEEIRTASAPEFSLGQANLRLSLKVPNQQNPINESVTFKFSRGDSESLTDSFLISYDSQRNALGGAGEQAIQRAIHRILSVMLQPVAPEDGGLLPTLSNLSQAFDSSYRRILKELSDAVESVSRERAAQLSEFQSERKKLREEISAEREEIVKNAQDAIETERNELAQQQRELENERSKLEISSHKDARRKQFYDLQNSLNASLEAPVADRGLRLTRWAIFLALLLSGMAAGAFAFMSFNMASWEAAVPPSTTDRFSLSIILILRSSLLSLASLASFVGAAAWLRYFYNRDLQAQEEMRRFRNDMARASWVMEASLEIRKEHNEEIPLEWISGVTEGLFSSKGTDHMDEGARALAAIMGMSAGAKVGANGLELELSRKGRRAIADAAED